MSASRKFGGSTGEQLDSGSFCVWKHGPSPLLRRFPNWLEMYRQFCLSEQYILCATVFLALRGLSRRLPDVYWGVYDHCERFPAGSCKLFQCIYLCWTKVLMNWDPVSITRQVISFLITCRMALICSDEQIVEICKMGGKMCLHSCENCLGKKTPWAVLHPFVWCVEWTEAKMNDKH